MTTKHLLGVSIDGQFGMVSWTLTCHHELGEFPTVDPDTDEVVGDDCWATDWFDEVGFEDSAAGDWPSEIMFPCPVRPVWEDGLALYYDSGGEL